MLPRLISPASHEFVIVIIITILHMWKVKLGEALVAQGQEGQTAGRDDAGLQQEERLQGPCFDPRPPTASH